MPRKVFCRTYEKEIRQGLLTNEFFSSMVQ
jgi:hypothetical protein